MKRVLHVPAILIVLAAMLAGSCTSSSRSSRVQHIVLLELLDPADATALLADSHATITAIPGVVAYASGRCMASDRPAVSGEYDACIVMGFESVQAYDQYLAHPKHEALVQRWRPRIKSMLVHDVQLRRPERGE